MRKDYADLGGEVLLISADPPAESLRFREKLGVRIRILADEHHEVGDRYGVQVEPLSPRQFTYANGYTQPAAFVYVGEQPVFRWIQTPGRFNLGGAANRPSPRKLLRILRRGVKTATAAT